MNKMKGKATRNQQGLHFPGAFSDIASKQLERARRSAAAHEQMRRRVQLLLENDDLTVAYQPIYDMAEGKIIGLEALSRFTVEPKRPPDVWFDEAAQVGLGVELENRSVRLALRALSCLSPTVYVAVNMSPETVLSGHLERMLNGVPRERVVVEITEHSLIEEYAQLQDVLRPLRDQGLRIAVDDAGAGYASFRHILNLAPDIIKLDMSLTRNIDTEKASRALSAALVRFAFETGSSVIAEGVETAEELEILRDIGITTMQGYFLDRPMPIEQAVLRCEGDNKTSRMRHRPER